MRGRLSHPYIESATALSDIFTISISHDPLALACNYQLRTSEKYKSEWLKQVAVGSDIRDPYQSTSMLGMTYLKD